MIEGQLFALLIEDIVVVGVRERVYAVFSGGNAFDDKLAALSVLDTLSMGWRVNMLSLRSL